jgi:hypothetical protein
MLTVRELSVVWGRDVGWVRRKLRELIAAKRIEVGRKPSSMIDGRPSTSPGYRLVDPPCTK